MTKLLSRKSLGLVFLSLIIFLSVFPVKSHAETSSSEPKVIRVGYYENEIFEEGASEGNIKKGYAYEYYRKISEYTGWKYEYVYGDFVTTYNMLLNGEVDLLAGLAYTQEREGQILYPIEPMGVESYGLVKHAGDDSVTEDPSTLNGIKIGILNNSSTGESLMKYLRANRINARILRYSDPDRLLSAFDQNEVSVIVAEYEGAYDRHNAEIFLSFGHLDYYLTVSRFKPELLDELNAAQSLLFSEEPSFVSSLRAKYYPASLSSKAFSKEERNWINNNHFLKVGYLNNYLPYSDTDESGNVTGMVKDLFPALVKNLGISNIKILYTGYDNYDDLIKAVSDETIDVAFPTGGGLFFSEEDGIYLSNPVASTVTNIIFNDNRPASTNVVFAVNENNKMQKYYIMEYYPDYSIKEYSSVEACLDAVLAGEVKCTTLNGLRTNDMLRDSRYKDLSFKQMRYTDDRCCGVKLGNEALLRLLNRGINIMGQDYLLNLANPYSSVASEYTVADYARKYAVVIVLLVILILALLAFFLARDKKLYEKRKREKEADTLELERVYKGSSVFLNNLAHDLRNPVSAINGLIDLIEHTDDKKLWTHYFNGIKFFSGTLMYVINDILDFSKLESGKVILNPERVNIRDIINEVRSTTNFNAAEKQLVYTVNYKNIKHSYIMADKLRLSQILTDVVFKSIAFSNAQGILDLSVEERLLPEIDKTSYVFKIKDNGMGLSDELMDTLYDPYKKEKEATSDGIGMQGLGLAVTKRLVDLMKGTIEVYTKKGEGTECIIEIPFDIAGTESSNAQATEHKDIDSFDFTGKRILIVEDEPLLQAVSAKTMKQVGFEIQIASDFSEAYEKMQAAPSGYFDVILADEEPTSIDTCVNIRKIRSIAEEIKAKVPIVLVSENKDAIDIAAVKDAGANEVVYKNLDYSKIMEVLEKLLN